MLFLQNQYYTDVNTWSSASVYGGGTYEALTGTYESISEHNSEKSRQAIISKYFVIVIQREC